MIYELRQYTVDAGRWVAFREWGMSKAFPVLVDEFDLPLVGFFETHPVDDLDDQAFNRVTGVHWILAWNSIEERHRRMGELRSSEAWHNASVEAIGPDGASLYITDAQITFLTAWPGSPLQ